MRSESIEFVMAFCWGWLEVHKGTVLDSQKIERLEAVNIKSHSDIDVLFISADNKGGKKDNNDLAHIMMYFA